MESAEGVESAHSWDAAYAAGGSDRIVPIPWVASPFCAFVPMEVEGGHFVGCSVAIEDVPAGDRARSLTERLPLMSSVVEWILVQICIS